MPMQKEKIPLLYCLGILLGSLFLTASFFHVSFRYYQHLMEIKKSDRKYQIESVIQTSNEKEPLKTSYLSELMGLSIDKPSNLHAVKEHILEKKILETPFIKRVSIQKIFPKTLYVDYVVRRPIAYLKDFSNTLISDEGFLMPFKPFFSPKNLPFIYLNVKRNALEVKEKIPDNIMRFINEWMDYVQCFFEERKMVVSFIDFSRAYYSNQGEITLAVEGGLKKESFLIRLSVDSYKENLVLFDLIKKKEEKLLKLKRKKELHLIIDLRTRGMALVNSR